MGLIQSVIRFFLTLGISGILFGCANLEQFQKKMDSHVGQHIDVLRQTYGYNYIERKLPQGRRVYTWVWRMRNVTPGYQTPTVIHRYHYNKRSQVFVIPGSFFPPEIYESVCEFSFITNSNGVTISWRAHGNGCSIYPGPEPSLGPESR